MFAFICFLLTGAAVAISIYFKWRYDRGSYWRDFEKTKKLEDEEIMQAARRDRGRV